MLKVFIGTLWINRKARTMSLIKTGNVFVNQQLDFYITADETVPKQGYKELDQEMLDKLCMYVNNFPLTSKEYKSFEKLIQGIVAYEKRTARV